MTDDGTLFGKRKRRPRWTGSTALVLVGHETCPSCGAATEDDVAGQLPLLRHGGHGAVATVRRRRCTTCTWSLVVEQTETRPPR